MIRKNTIAASRDGSDKLKCLFDSLVVYAKVYNEVDAEGVLAFDQLPTVELEAPPIVKDNILALLETRIDPSRAVALRKTFDFYRQDGFGKVRPGSSGSWGAPAAFFTENIIGRRWVQLARRDADFVKWSDEILPASKNDSKMVREKKQREFNDVIRRKAKAGRNRDACRMLDHVAMALWRTHWDCDYMGYIDRTYIPAMVNAGGETLFSLTVYNNLHNDPKSWIKSEDIVVPTPSKHREGAVWSVEGILSGAYDKLTPDEKQWYLHTHGPIQQ